MHSIDWEIAGVTIFYHHSSWAATHCLWRDPPFNFSSRAGHQKWTVSSTQPLPQQSTLSNWNTWSPVLRRGTPLNMSSIQTVLGTRSGLSDTQPLLQQSTASNWSTWTSVWWRVTPLNMPSTQAGWSSRDARVIVQINEHVCSVRHLPTCLSQHNAHLLAHSLL